MVIGYMDTLRNFRQKLLVVVIFLFKCYHKDSSRHKKGRSEVIFVWDEFLNIVWGL